jgi:hypothetical protein
VDTPVQQQVQHWQRVKLEADMDSFIVDSIGKPVNPLLGSLDESFEWNASIKLQRSRGKLVRRAANSASSVAHN